MQKTKTIAHQIREHQSTQGKLRIGTIATKLKGIKAKSFGSGSVKSKPGVGLRRLAERARSYAKGRKGLGLQGVGGQQLRKSVGYIKAPKVN